MPALLGVPSLVANVAKSGRSLAGPEARGELILAGAGSATACHPSPSQLRLRPALPVSTPVGPRSLKAVGTLPELRARVGRSSRPRALSSMCSSQAVTLLTVFPPL